MALLVLVVGLGILLVRNGAMTGLLAWDFGHTTVTGHSLGSETLSRRVFTATIVLGCRLKGIVGTLDTTLHCCLACRVLGKSGVTRGCCALSASRCRSSLIDHLTLSIGFVLCRITIDVPSRIHHLHEVVFVVDAGRDGSVVFEELGLGHDTVGNTAESHLEGGQEFLKDLALSFATLKDCRVFFGVVSVTDVVVIDLTASILV